MPMPVPRPHPEDNPDGNPDPADLLPNRHFALWPYTRPDDPRFKWQPDGLLIHQRPGLPATKIGCTHREQLVGYLNDGVRFTKTVAFDHDARYPDGGCNLEIFTNSEMLELETLSGFVRLKSGESASHEEHWRLDQLN